jgi:hypothetical protein
VKLGWLLLGALPLLGGCPIPQPLAEVSKPGSGTVTPPRIVVEAAALGTIGTLDGVVPYDPACPGGARFTVAASVIDDFTDEVANFRWFVDYDRGGANIFFIPVGTDVLPPPTLQPLNRRTIPPLSFRPSDIGAAPHLLELVVSNGFGSLGTSPVNRAPAPGYEVQVFRWLFVELPQASGGRCN